MEKTILLIGCGNIGRCHLQAIANTRRKIQVILVDPDVAAIDKAEKILAKAPWINAQQVTGLQELPKNPVVLAIIATDARLRRSMVHQLLNHAPPQALLLEKVLFQTRKDLDAVEILLQEYNIPTWVNCGRRGFPFYEKLRALFQGRRMDVEVRGGRWGLCCNGIHFLDIAEYVLDDTLVSLCADELEEESEAAKRPGCVELYGTLRGRFSRGSSLALHCTRKTGKPMTLSFTDSDECWLVDETGAVFTHTDEIGKKNSEPFDMLYVSSMHYLYAEILDSRTSRLTPYAASAAQHRLFLDAVRQRLGLSNKRDEPCPIT